jgi:hypothetical protein
MTARLWFLLPADISPPDWCADFFGWLGGKRIAPDGQIETLSGDELLKLEARLRPHMNENSDYGRLLRWRLLTAEERPLDPYDRTTQAQAADLIIRPDMNKYEAEHAYDLDPWHPLVHLALAGITEPLPCFVFRYSELGGGISEHLRVTAGAGGIANHELRHNHHVAGGQVWFCLVLPGVRALRERR